MASNILPLPGRAPVLLNSSLSITDLRTPRAPHEPLDQERRHGHRLGPRPKARVKPQLDRERVRDPRPAEQKDDLVAKPLRADHPDERGRVLLVAVALGDD